MGLFDVSPVEQDRMRKARKFLRLFLMDTPELNRLIRGYEIDEDRLELAIMLFVSSFNTTTPILRPVSLGNFPSFYLLIMGSAVQCLKMAGLYQSRNELTYNSGGSSFIRSNKTPYYQSWIANFDADVQAKVLNLKIQQNVEGAYGSGFSSEYDLIGFDF